MKVSATISRDKLNSKCYQSDQLTEENDDVKFENHDSDVTLLATILIKKNRIA